MLLQSQSIPDLYKVLRIIDDINEGDLYNEDDNASDEECEISLAVTPDHLNSDTETIDSINSVQSGSGITVAAATTSDVPGRSEISSDSDSGQQEGDTRPKTSAYRSRARGRRGKAPSGRGHDQSRSPVGRGHGRGRHVARSTARTPSRDHGCSSVFTPRQNIVPLSGNVGPT